MWFCVECVCLFCLCVLCLRVLREMCGVMVDGLSFVFVVVCARCC